MENKLPEGWESVKLNDNQLFSYETGVWKGEKDPFVEVPIIRTTNFNNDGKLDFNDVVRIPVEERQIDKKRLLPGDIIIEKSGGGPTQPVGRVAFFDREDEIYLCNNFTSRLRILDKTRINPRYLHLYLFAFHASGKTTSLQRKTTGIRNLNMPDYKKIQLPIPPLETQQKIVSILKKAEETKKLRAQADELTQKLLQSAFLEMFGDPVTNSKKWDMTKLGECTEFMTSGSRGWAKYYSDTGEKFIRIQNVKNGSLDFSDIQLVEPPETAESIRTRVKDGDLLISITADLGRTAVVDEQTALEGAYINQHLALIRLNKKIVDPVFVSQYLESEGGKRQFSSLDQKGVKSGLNFESVRSLEFYLPPLSVQKEFSSLVEKLELIWKNQAQSSLEINTLFDVLMQKAFIGKLVS